MNFLAILCFFIFFLVGSCQPTPFFKDIDYKLYDHDNGIAVDSIFELVADTPASIKHRRHATKLLN